MIDLIGWPEAKHCAGGDGLVVDKLLEHGLGVGEQGSRSFADNLVVKNARVFASQIPGYEEGRPVDVLCQYVEIDLVEYLHSFYLRRRRLVALPVQFWSLLDCLRIAQIVGACAAVGCALAHHGVVFTNLLDVVRLEFFGQQCGRNADCA